MRLVFFLVVNYHFLIIIILLLLLLSSLAHQGVNSAPFLKKKKKDKKFELKTSIVAVAESGLPPCASMCAAWTFGNAGIGPRVPKVSFLTLTFEPKSEFD